MLQQIVDLLLIGHTADALLPRLRTNLLDGAPVTLDTHLLDEIPALNVSRTDHGEFPMATAL
ncbi:hypothetical protein DPMN_050397 [Dreissena polymorpha]|uniref:Uncharacterized protein n=1 Tax=Dreissena polymorpha TaxID=45954 RepID=A0A9D4CH49_DREPO|nr:hypothetical protein DPMN_050397 [Dreissena polymorpha]